MSLQGAVLPLDDPTRLAWLGRLVGATTPEAVVALVVELGLAQPACGAAWVVWLDVASGACRGGGAGVPAFAPGLLHALQRDDAPMHQDGCRLALRLASDVVAALVVELREAVDPEALRAALAPDLELAGAQLHQALALAELYDSHRRLERSESLQRALFAISDLAGSDLEMPELLRCIHGIVSMLMYAENFYIVRYDAARGTMRFLYFADVVDPDGVDTSREMRLDDMHGSLTWHLLTKGRALMGSAEELAAQVDGPLNVVGPDSEDWLGVPMMRDHVVQGALVVQSYRAGIAYSEDDRALLAFVGSHILTALERKQSKDELEQRVGLRTQELAEAIGSLRQEVLERQRAERLQAALFQLAHLATEDIGEGAFYERVHAVVGQLLDARNFFIALLDGARQRLDFPYYVDTGELHMFSRPFGRGLSEYVLRLGRAWLGRGSDIDELYRAGEVVPHLFGKPPKHWLGVPLRAGGEVIGLVAVQSYDDSIGYGPAEQELLGFAALQIANGIHRRRSAEELRQAKEELELRVAERTLELRTEIARREHAQQKLRHQVMHDTLTGLANRGLLRERLEAALARAKREPGQRCALLYLDVDRFKIINDSLGHLAGDAFLKTVSQRLMQCVREPDLVARLSGDEFAILLEGVGQTDAVEQVAQRVLQTLAQPLLVAGRELEPSASVGIAIGGEGYSHADALLRDADVALYRAKELGRKRYVLFDETLARDAEDVLTLEGELRQALLRDEFEPYFQPICRLDNDVVVGYEVLLRWNHPRRGLLAPDDFVRVAQDSGQIEAIDWRIFARACERFAALGGHGYLSINVAPLHLRNADFDRRLLALLDRSGMPPARLVVEVTEGALLDDTAQTKLLLERLYASGVEAALDDFGTGYASLSYLHALPLGKLKIDRSFVQTLDRDEPDSGTAVVLAIIALARALGIEVIAEGIETQQQREALLAMGCVYGQGFLLGRPAPAQQWLAGVADGTRG